MTINTENEYGKFHEFEESLEESAEAIIERTVNTALRFENCPYECSVNVLFTDDDAIHRINLEQRNIDRSTDILSFAVEDDPENLGFVLPEGVKQQEKESILRNLYNDKNICWR